MAFLTTDQVSRKLGLSQATIRRMVSAGELPAVRLGRLLRISEEAVRLLIEQNLTPTKES